MIEILALGALTFAAGLLVALNEAARPLRPHREHRAWIRRNWPKGARFQRWTPPDEGDR